MRKPAITFDAILTALAVLGAGTACSKAERAAAEPATVAPASSAPAKEEESPAPAALPPPAPDLAPTTEAPKVDAGVERTPARKPKGASAACGATGCSADMRKGGK